MIRLLFAALFAVTLVPAAGAQSLTVATVTRPPFSMPENGQDAGFSMDLWREVASRMGIDFTIKRVESFQDMLALVRDSKVDLAIANISITADREKVMDFSQPIFASGLQIMTHGKGSSRLALLRAIFSRDMITAILLAFAVLFGIGMLMWWFERRAQPYFDKPPKQALFPAFWWALNLVVNGGFEERVPRTIAGRLFGVLLVVSSLFLVSFFVARITAVMTVDAIQNNVNSVNDLYGKQVGTIQGSTAAAFLENRDLPFRAFPGLQDVLQAFETGALDAVVFDAPILAYYVQQSNSDAALAGPPFLRENYGIALPAGSPLAEPINRILLRLRETGVYDRIYRKWFGRGPG